MRIVVLIILGSILQYSSCERKNKFRGADNMPVSENVTPEIQDKTIPDTPKTVRQVEERLVANNNRFPENKRYFVIIGSFKNQDNAQKYQSQILKNGFISEILKNEEGLYRVSVMATNDLKEAINEVKRIWITYPEYYDTWLLVRKKTKDHL